MHGQYTRTWSKAYVDGQYVGQLEGVSSTSASLGGAVRERARISANINWDYDGPSVAQTFTEIEGLSAYQNSFSWVTAQLSYEFVPGLQGLRSRARTSPTRSQRTYLANRSDAVWSVRVTERGHGQQRQGRATPPTAALTLSA